ncbi:G-type lectin S-receptor-like serine/threonine-protein kinase [Citrus sinensis]|nr:G-type lectin S-receptor-like serine/threonine-protein kinase [Citrus sinensis]
MYVKCSYLSMDGKNILNCFEMVSRRERFQRRIIRRWSDNTYHLRYSLSMQIYNITFGSLLCAGQTLASAGERFELGFFSSANSSEAEGIPIYVGLWYYKDKPLPYNGGVLAIAEDGKLKLLDENGIPYWYTEVERSSPLRRVAKLMDSGNFVLQDDQVGISLWESFKHPTDTFLAGTYMAENLSSTSWAGQDDPKPGNFTFKMDQGENQYQITKPFIWYWRIAELQDVFSPDEIIPYQILYLLSNFSQSVNPAGKKYVHNNLTVTPIDYSRTRLIMNCTGEIQCWIEDKVKGWSLIWWEPRDPCSVIHSCGTFGSCNSNYERECQCLPGFGPVSPEHWNSRDFSGGPTGKTALCGGKDMFLRLKMTKIWKTDSNLPVNNETKCLKECLSSCRCQAYSYEESDNTRRDNPSDGGTCWIWTEELNDLQQGFSNGSRVLCVRVAASDLELTKRNYETCGTNLIPYPLSTKADCGQINFMAPIGTYSVTGIYPDSRNFSIQLKGADNYRRNPNGTFHLNQSLPFYFIALANLGNSTFYFSYKNAYEVEIGWNPPPEPTRTSPRDCEDWPHSTCKLTDNGETRCLCNETFRWDGNALKCIQHRAENKPGGDSTQQVDAFNGRKKQQWTLIFGVTIASGIILSCIIIYFYTRRRSINRPNMAARFYESARHVKEMVDSDQFKEEDKKGIDLPFIDFESILAATDNFSEANKLRGLFTWSFKNEHLLIARLQHRNLILLSEYMPNKSLDFFIFDATLSVLLDMEMLFNIILGVARGLLYLHQDSKLRIIHRDFKTSNILLDHEMNPKISDFGLTRIFEGKQTDGTTNRVVGT